MHRSNYVNIEGGKSKKRKKSCEHLFHWPAVKQQSDFFLKSSLIFRSRSSAVEHTDGHFSGHFRRRRGSSGWSSECCEFYSICGEIYLGHNSDYCTTGKKDSESVFRGWLHMLAPLHQTVLLYWVIWGGKAFPRQLTPQTCSCSTSPKWLVKVCVFIFNLIESKQKLSIWYWLFFYWH